MRMRARTVNELTVEEFDALLLDALDPIPFQDHPEPSFSEGLQKWTRNTAIGWGVLFVTSVGGAVIHGTLPAVFSTVLTAALGLSLGMAAFLVLTELAGRVWGPRWQQHSFRTRMEQRLMKVFFQTQHPLLQERLGRLLACAHDRRLSRRFWKRLQRLMQRTPETYHQIPYSDLAFSNVAQRTFFVQSPENFSFPLPKRALELAEPTNSSPSSASNS